ncbi:DUF4382 domain-containing protein [Chloroflexota bacterium]
MRRTLGLLAAMLLLIISVAACAPADNGIPAGDVPEETATSPSVASTSETDENTDEGISPAADEDEASPEDTSQEDNDATHGGSTNPNFRLLISDEKNDIEDFSELWITVVGIGLVQGDEEGVEEEWFEPADVVDVNLRELEGEDAVEAWVGYIESGDYVKVFLYVDDVWGVLVDAVEGEEPIIKLPSNKLQLKLPVRIEEAEEGEEQELVDFVFDITVHSAGNSGQYILSPQASESGQGKTYRLLEHTEERVTKGKPDWSSKPEDTGKPDWAAQPGGRNNETEEED